MLDAALSALRMGTLDMLIRQRPQAARWLMRPLLPVLAETAGNATLNLHDSTEMASLLLR